MRCSEVEVDQESFGSLLGIVPCSFVEFDIQRVRLGVVALDD